MVATSTTRTCRLCGARLRSGNTTGVCSCHDAYDPRHDPGFGEWLLRTLRRRRGRVTYPLEQLCKAGKVVAGGRSARDCVHKHIEKLRRAGHFIRGVRGRAGGYIYVCGPNDGRVSELS